MSEMIEPFAAPEIYVDGFEDHEVRDGILTCAGFRIQKGVKIAVIRIVMPVAGLGKAIQSALDAARNPLPDNIIALMPPRTAH